MRAKLESEVDENQKVIRELGGIEQDISRKSKEGSSCGVGPIPGLSAILRHVQERRGQPNPLRREKPIITTGMAFLNLLQKLGTLGLFISIALDV
jgi:hypothetical protein